MKDFIRDCCVLVAMPIWLPLLILFSIMLCVSDLIERLREGPP